MHFNIPKELAKYVRMSQDEGLVYQSDMPESLVPLFEKTRAEVMAQQKGRRTELESLLIKED